MEKAGERKASFVLKWEQEEQHPAPAAFGCFRPPCRRRPAPALQARGALHLLPTDKHLTI